MHGSRLRVARRAPAAGVDCGRRHSGARPASPSRTQPPPTPPADSQQRAGSAGRGRGSTPYRPIRRWRRRSSPRPRDRSGACGTWIEKFPRNWIYEVVQPPAHYRALAPSPDRSRLTGRWTMSTARFPHSLCDGLQRPRMPGLPRRWKASRRAGGCRAMTQTEARRGSISSTGSRSAATSFSCDGVARRTAGGKLPRPRLAAWSRQSWPVAAGLEDDADRTEAA